MPLSFLVLINLCTAKFLLETPGLPAKVSGN